MITRFIEAWILPPGLFVLLLLACGLLTLRVTSRMAQESHGNASLDRARTRVRQLGIVLLALSASLYLFSAQLVSRALIGSLEQLVSPASERSLRNARAVVVLGGGLVVLNPGADGQTMLPAGTDRLPAALPAEALARLVEGVLLAESLGVPLVVSGGRVFAGARVPAEATVAAYLASELGGSELEILIEDGSRSTAENARRVAEHIAPGPVALVTSAYHLPRAVRSFERNGITALPVPAAYRSDRRPFHAVMLLPSASALDDSATWMREQVARIWYALRGS